MLYILRLANGDSVVALAADEDCARQTALQLLPEHSAEVSTVRRLEDFAIQLSPTVEGSLEIALWEDAALDGILAAEYPALYAAYQRANAQPFTDASAAGTPSIERLRAWHEGNAEIIREGLRRERERLNLSPKKSKAVRAGAQRQTR